MLGAEHQALVATLERDLAQITARYEAELRVLDESQAARELAELELLALVPHRRRRGRRATETIHVPIFDLLPVQPQQTGT